MTPPNAAENRAAYCPRCGSEADWTGDWHNDFDSGRRVREATCGVCGRHWKDKIT